MHHHEHTHNHGNGESCGCDECRVPIIPGAVTVELKLHNEAIVVSGAMTVFAEYETVREALKTRLEGIARAVTDSGGVVGHIKASASVTRVDMFSVTDEKATVKSTPETEIGINLAAIVFLVPPEEAKTLVRDALEGVKADIKR